MTERILIKTVSQVLNELGCFSEPSVRRDDIILLAGFIQDYVDVCVELEKRRLGGQLPASILQLRSVLNEKLKLISQLPEER